VLTSMEHEFGRGNEMHRGRPWDVARRTRGLTASVGRTAFTAMLLAAVTSAGCAGNATRPTTNPSPPTLPASWVHTPQTIQHIPVERPSQFDVPRPEQLAVVVRGVTRADRAVVDDAEKRSDEFVGGMYGMSAGVGASGFAVPGYLGAQMLTSVLFIAPLVLTIDVAAQNTIKTVNRALKEVDLISETLRALQARGVPTEPVTGEATQVTLSVIAFGLVPKNRAVTFDSGEVCLIVEADLIVTANKQEIFRDAIQIKPYQRSADAPAPACRSLMEFSDEEGRSLRNAAHDYALVLAALTLRRIKKLPWKP